MLKHQWGYQTHNHMGTPVNLAEDGDRTPRLVGAVLGPLLGVVIALLVGYDPQLAPVGPLGLPLQEVGFIIVYAGFGATLTRAGARGRWEVVAGGLVGLGLGTSLVIVPFGELGASSPDPVADFVVAGALGMIGVFVAVLYDGFVEADLGPPIHVPREAVLFGIGFGAVMYLIWSPIPTRDGSTTMWLLGIMTDLLWHLGGPALIGIVVATLAVEYRLFTPAVFALVLGIVAVVGFGTGITVLDPIVEDFAVDWYLLLGVVLAPAGLERGPHGQPRSEPWT